MPSSQAAALTPTYATTSCQQAVSSCARMPLSIASPTRCQPTTGRRPRRRRAASRRRCAAGGPRCSARAARARCGAGATRQGPRPRTARVKAPPRPSSSRGHPVLDDAPVLEHDGAVGDEDRRQALARRSSTVRPATAGRRFSTRCRSVSVSTADIGSSSTSTRAPADQRARERDALALAAGEVDAPLADQRVVACGQLVGERRHAGRLAGGEHLVPVGVRARGEQVVAQEHREQDGPLRHEADRAPQLGQRARRACRRRRRSTRAAGRVVEARQQVQQRRLAGPGRPADGDDLARGDLEVDAATAPRAPVR